MKLFTATVLLAFTASAIACWDSCEDPDKRSIGLTSYPRALINAVVNREPSSEKR
jgi:hypothetical protein